MPEPFEKCAPQQGGRMFSRRRTEVRLIGDPDTCCYVELEYVTQRGRPLLVGPQARAATLRRGGW